MEEEEDREISRHSISEARKFSSPSTSHKLMNVPKSPLERIHEREMSKIEELWHGAQEELKKTSEELKLIEERQRLQDLQKEEAHKQEVERLNSRIDYLEDKLKFTESQLSKARREKIDAEIKFRDEKTQLESQIRDLTESLQRAESLLETRSKMLQIKKQQLQELTSQINEMTEEKEELLNKSTQELTDKDLQLAEAEKKLQEQEARIKLQEEDIKYLSKQNEVNRATISELEDLKDEHEQANAETQKLLNRAKGQLSMLKNKRKRKMDLEIKLNQLKVDNARLTKMLASTGLFKEFLEYVQDSNGAAYIPVGFRDEDLEGSMVTFGESRNVDPSVEWKFWVPQDAYDLAHAFQNKYLPDVREDLFSELLQKLNLVWHQQEVRKIAKLKAQHTEAIKDLRRQMMQQQSADDVTNMERINFLKRELQKAKSPQQTRINDMKTTVLDSTLVKVEHLSREVKRLKKENKELRASTSTSRGGDADFVEGAAWFGRKVTAMSDHLAQKITDLALEYQQKVLVESSRQTTTPGRLVKMQGTFLRTLERSVLIFREKLKTLFERVIKCLENGESVFTVKFDTLDLDIDSLPDSDV